MVSASERAKRALVTLIKSLAGVYGVTLDITRDCKDDGLRKAYNKMFLYVHPGMSATKAHEYKSKGIVLVHIHKRASS